MSLLGSAFGRGLAGAGRGAADIANKYIDHELSIRRAQSLADIQRESNVQQIKDVDGYNNSDERRARLRDLNADDTLAAAQATRDATTAGANDPGYQGALDTNSRNETQRKIDGTVAELKGTTGARVESEVAIVNGTAGAKANAAGLIATAQERARDRFKDKPGDGSVDKIAAIEQSLGRKLSEDEKLSIFGLGKKKDGIDPIEKLAQEATSKALEAGTIKPEEAGQHTETIRRSFAAVALEGRIGTGVAKARQEGKTAEAIAELRAKGLDDKRLATYFTADELKAAAPAGSKTAAGTSAPAARDPARESLSPRQQWQGDKRAAAQGVTSAASAALASKDPQQAQAIMDHQHFDLLDQPTKQAIRSMVYGR